MLTERDMLTSVIFAVVLTTILTLMHSMTILYYTVALCTVALGVYLSLLAHMYQKKYVQASPSLQQSVKKEDEFSGGWWAGWYCIAGAMIFFFWGLSSQWTPSYGNPPIYLEAALCGMFGFMMGLGYPMSVWWLWRKYVAGIKRLA